MILHLIPKLFCPWQDVALLDLQIKSLGLHLKGGIDLVTRRPYPNKRVAVACRKQGQKAIEGILIDTKVAIDVAECVTRWTIGGAGIVTLLASVTKYWITILMWLVAKWGCGALLAKAWATGRAVTLIGRKDVAPCDGEPMMAVIPEKKTRPMFQHKTSWTRTQMDYQPAPNVSMPERPSTRATKW